MVAGDGLVATLLVMHSTPLVSYWSCVLLTKCLPYDDYLFYWSSVSLASRVTSIVVDLIALSAE